MSRAETEGVCRRLLAALVVSALTALGTPAATHGAEERQTIAGGVLFARLSAERSELFLQEVFDFTFSVYSRGLTMGREISLLNPETPGLTFLPFQDLGSRREEIDGRVFDVHRFLGRGQAVATGSYALRPTARLSVVVRGRGGTRSGAASGPAEVRPVDLQPSPSPVVVRALPEAGKPEGFSGAVGDFAFSAVVRPAAAVEGEPVTLTMSVEGRGNVESVAAPRVPAGDRFKTYEPKLLRKEIGADRSRGRLVFEQVLVPRSTASTPVPAVTFSYFDPERRSYRRLVEGPFPLSVAPSAHPGGVMVEAPSSGPAGRRMALRSEIAPLKPEPSGWSSWLGRPWRPPVWLLALQIVPPGLVVALFLVVRRREELARDVVKARRQLAPSAARSGLGAVEEALRAGDAARFHEALWAALATYFGHRFNLLPGEISGEAVTARLAAAGLDAALVSRLGEVFRLLEQERFSRPSAAAPLHSASERHRLAGLLGELDRILAACEEMAL